MAHFILKSISMWENKLYCCHNSRKHMRLFCSLYLLILLSKVLGKDLILMFVLSADILLVQLLIVDCELMFSRVYFWESCEDWVEVVPCVEVVLLLSSTLEMVPPYNYFISHFPRLKSSKIMKIIMQTWNLSEYDYEFSNFFLFRPKQNAFL